MTPERTKGQDKLWIGLLGGFRAERGSKHVPISAWQKRGNTQAVVKLLALTPSHCLHRDQILDMLWPELGPEAADRALRKAMHYARHALEPEMTEARTSHYVLLHDGIVSLAPEDVTVDIDVFRARAEEALRRADGKAIEEALALYAGDLLPEDLYKDWTKDRRDELSDLRLGLLVSLAGILEEEGSYASAIDRLQQVLATDATREEIHRAIMRLHSQAGSVHAAIRQYTMCVAILRRDLDTEPDEETETLRLQITSNLRAAPLALYPTQGPLPRTIRRSESIAFVGRERALELLTESRMRAEHGAGEVVLVAGEAGVGKTRLVTEMAREAHQNGDLVLWGSSQELEGTTPYGAIVEALEGFLYDRPDAERAEVLRDFPVVGRLVSSLHADETEQVDLVSGGNKVRLFASIARLFRDFGAKAPVILIFDDLHAADSATLEVLHYLARAARYERWLLLGTYREEEINPGSPLHYLRTALTRVGICRRIDLHRLARPETEMLARKLLTGGAIPAHLYHELHMRSAGNPLFLQELVQTMRERDHLELHAGEWRVNSRQRALPSGVRELVEERVHRLGEVAERMLAVAAVAGMQVPFDVLLGATGLDMESFLTTLDRALDARILEEVGPDYVFRHPLVRAALYDRLPEQRRMRLHETVGQVLEATNPDAVEALAHHFTKSGHDCKAVKYLELAGDHAATTFANDAAMQFYEDATARVVAQGDAAARARIAEKQGNVLAMVGKYAEAAATYADALQDATDPVYRVRLQRSLARTWEKQGSYIAVLAVLDSAESEAWASPGVVPATLLTDILIIRANALLGLARFDEAVTVAEEAIAALGAHPDQVLQADIHYVQGRIAFRQGKAARAVAIFERCLSVAESKGNLQDIARCLGALGAAATSLGNMNTADTYERRCIEINERIGHQHGVATGWNNLGVVAHLRGDFNLAREYYRKCIPIREEIGDREGLAVSWINLAEAALNVGDLEEAEEDCRRSIELYEETQDAYGMAYVTATRAAILFAQGEMHGAQRAWQESLDSRQRIGDELGTVDAMLGLAEIALSRDDVEGAHRGARDACRLARGRSPELEARSALLQIRIKINQGRIWQTQPLLAHARRLAQEHSLGRIAALVSLVDAERYLTAHCWLRARLLAQQSLEDARRSGLHIEEGIALRLLGIALLGEGKLEEGKDALSCSVSLLRHIGAQREAGRSENQRVFLLDKHAWTL